MKLAIAGKGGVGKTTVAALLARRWAEEGRRVIAVDADPDANLGSALGIPEEVLARITPIARMEELVRERTGARPGQVGSWFILNPRVEDLPEKLWVEDRGVRLLVMGGIRGGGAGCACPENALLKAMLRHLVLGREEELVCDMEAGLEHLGRGTAHGVDRLLVVVEPSHRSLQTAHAVAALASELGLRRVVAVANKVADPEQRDFVEAHLNLPLLHCLPHDPQLRRADMLDTGVWEASPLLRREIGVLARRLRAEVQPS